MKKIGFVIKQFIKMFTQAVILPIWYAIHRHNEIDRNLVIFADAHSHELPHSMLLMHEKFEKNGYNVVDFFSDYGHDSPFVTIKNMLKFTKMYAKAHYVFICNYFLPVASVRKKKETKVVQLWHACGIFKRFAHDTDDDIPKYYKFEVIKNYDLVTVSSETCVPVYANAMHLDEKKVRATGVSRTDRFFDEEYIKKCREKLYRLYPEAKGKKLAVWAPTFRGNAALPYLEGQEDIMRLKEQLPDDWFLLVRLHQHLLDYKINCDIPTEELLPVADLLISDYSTVVFEFSLMNKPLVLFVPDYETYGKHRGFYIEFESLPGSIVTDENELAEKIIYEYEHFDSDRMKAFASLHMSACDGNSTDRIFDLITSDKL